MNCDTTSAERHAALLERLAAAPLSLMAMLASPCALVVEHAALLLGALAEPSAPRAAMRALRDHALSEGVVLRNVRDALFARRAPRAYAVDFFFFHSLPTRRRRP